MSKPILIMAIDEKVAKEAELKKIVASCDYILQSKIASSGISEFDKLMDSNKLTPEEKTKLIIKRKLMNN